MISRVKTTLMEARDTHHEEKNPTCATRIWFGHGQGDHWEVRDPCSVVVTHARWIMRQSLLGERGTRGFQAFRAPSTNEIRRREARFALNRAGRLTDHCHQFPPRLLIIPSRLHVRFVMPSSIYLMLWKEIHHDRCRSRFHVQYPTMYSCE
jgi:hypothetical protein